MALRYCPVCGQSQIDADPTLRDFLHQLAAEFLLWDGVLFTIALLTTVAIVMAVQF